MFIIFEKFFWFIYFKIYTLCFISDYVTKVLLVDLSFLFPSCLSPFFFRGNFPKFIFQLLCWNFLSLLFHLTFMILFPVLPDIIFWPHVWHQCPILVYEKFNYVCWKRVFFFPCSVSVPCSSGWKWVFFSLCSVSVPCFSGCPPFLLCLCSHLSC